MIKHISLRDFQSWRKLEMDLAPITMIVGDEGNVGKSAIVRALTYALTNRSGDTFIRNGAPKATVGIAFDDGTALMWTKRRGAGGTYVLANETGAYEFTKTGQVVPQEVVDATGFRYIDVDKNFSVSPQLADQFDPPFIVGESGSRVARVLGKLTKLDVLVQAQMLCRKDKGAAETHAKNFSSAVEMNKERLAELPDVDRLKEEFLEARAAVQTTATLLSQVEQAKDAVARYEQAQRIRLLDVVGVAEGLAEARGALDRVADGGAAVGRFEGAVQRVADATAERANAEWELEQLREQYEAQCSAQGICETCPWK